MRRVALLPTCVVDTVAPQVGVATVRVLRRLGYEVVVPENATCCGQPAWNTGRTEEAAKVARTTLAALRAEDAERICVPAGSCATMMRVFWQELFHLVGDDEAAEAARDLSARVWELSELVAEDGGLPGTLPERTVAYHHSCHMLRELGLRQPPEDAIAGIDGAAQVEWDGDDRCCGFGGLFSVKQPEISIAMADDKLDTLVATGARELIGCDQSCLMHLAGRLERRGDAVRVRHLAEVLDEATAPASSSPQGDRRKE